jgi:hypothetical protein
MTIPHRFPSLIDEPTTQTVLIAGAGLSFGYVPIVEELKGKLDQAAKKLGINPNGDFYELAESVLNNLTCGGKSDADSRLWLAEELGLLDDRRWFGERGLPLSGNTPRHRAIARFAVEERLKAIVSLNWDTLLEAALDSVGLAEGVRSPRPWKITAHGSVVENAHITRLANANVFPVIKPHGCVRNLEQARRQFRSTGTTPPVIFKLTQSELDHLPAGQTLVDKKVEGYLSECPLIAIGWKAREGYLRNTVAKTAKAVQHIEQDAFTLVDLFWDQNHTEIATAYGKNNNEAFAEVNADAQPTIDCLFQWLQARYALNKLMASSPANQATLQLFLQQLDQPVLGHFILRWVDSWLPTWVRLCWRAGVMQGNDPHTNKNIEPWDIPVMPRDVHVPLGTMTGERRELKAAAKLLAALGSDLSRFDFKKFPGGLWNAKTRSLSIPLPGWRGTAQPADLAALDPLVEALRGLGFVRDINLVWLDTVDTPINQTYRDQLAAQVGRLMPLEKFARSDALTWIDLEALKGDPHEPVA